MARLILFLVLYVFNWIVVAGSFTCTDERGYIFIQQKPCDQVDNEEVTKFDDEVNAALERGKKEAALLAKKQKEDRAKLIKSQFSVWDGSHHNLERLVKKYMKDPSSYKHVETRYWDNGANSITVLTRYRGKNSFGAVVLSTTKAKIDLKTGKVLSILN